VEHLEQHARRLAAEMGAVRRDRGDPALFSDLEASGRVLREVHRELMAAVEQGEPVTADAEWLLDNFSVVEDQLREIREDLPRGYYRDLPKVGGGRPRVYFLSLELIIHTDSALDEETLVRFLQAFQEGAPLSIGEIWAVPIMLRLALVENLRRLAMQLRANRACHSRAAEILDQWQTGQSLHLDLASLERCAPVVLELLEMLQEQGAVSASRLKELERLLTDRGADADQVVRLAHQQQAANQVSIGNVITSMRLISALDWMTFFERTSLTERALRQDPAGIYPQMDSATRDRYRHVIEVLAKHGQRSEPATAEQAVMLARHASDQQRPLVERHVGYYLVDQGRTALEQSLDVRLDAATRLRRLIHRNATAVYLGFISVVTLAGALAVVAAAMIAGTGWAVSALLGLVSVLPASELAVSLANFAVAQLFPPKRLPKMEFRDGVPPWATTVVVIPSLLSSRREVQSLAERLELHFLSNSDPNFRFALVTDYVDAPHQTMPADRELVDYAIERIRELNERYGTEGDGPFLLLHRERKWNASQQCWMGWERKRGKLMELNRLLLHGDCAAFPITEGNMESLLGEHGHPRIRFVVTLDSDTQLPPGTARKLVGTLAHPLNRPRIDSDGAIAAGYAILQPRLGVHLPAANRSWYARIFANSPGLDPYATAASDVYQDLFAEGSFTGKGIYDLAAFDRALAGVFPENHILSHDLIEGCHSRVGLVTDIELIDGFPARYDAEARRQHRWIRGDWQLLPWLLPRVPSENGRRPNRLSLLSWWKIFDNLRRSLIAPALVVLLLAGCYLAPQLAPLLVATVFLVLGFPFLVQVLAALRNWPRGMSWAEYRRAWSGDVLRSLAQTAISIALLPHRAWSTADAVLRTLVRLLITRRHLLEWETAAATEQRLSQSRWSSLATMWFPPVLAVASLVMLPFSASVWAAPLLAAWLGAPLPAWWLSQPIHARRASLADEQREWLRGMVLRTWSYFERFVTAEDNWLPPDNFQEYPAEKVAHRVSPTNEGLFLLSALIARDFGLIPLLELITLWERNLASWGKLGRLRGHFYNWYDTTNLQPLAPRYLSTVDSGNLAACFLTMHQGIDELRVRPLFGPMQWQGVLARVASVEQACSKLHPRGARLVSPPLDALQAGLANLSMLRDAPQGLADWRLRLMAAREQIAVIREQTEKLA
ncbi:MAG: cyclic beta 1-2 glucan synthetase, partial [Planctomycetaceae bacterium]|nr:cyclic beta 1-2 glucan synthetase [Planctomycetaceae bacterium]